MLHLKKNTFHIYFTRVNADGPPCRVVSLGCHWQGLDIPIYYNYIYHILCYPKSNLEIDVVVVLYTGLKRYIGKAEMRNVRDMGDISR